MKKVKKYIRKRSKYWLILASILPILVPHISMAHVLELPLVEGPKSVLNSSLWPNYQIFFDQRPAKRTTYVVVTAYNSEVGQTDSTPFITASGSHVRDGIIATNALRFGTKVRFPEVFGNKIFVVEDRMNKRYTNRADIWMAEKEAAKIFGVKYLKMEIL